MAYVRKRGNQVVIVQGKRDKSTGKVEQRILFTLYSKARPGGGDLDGARRHPGIGALPFSFRSLGVDAVCGGPQVAGGADRRRLPVRPGGPDRGAASPGRRRPHLRHERGRPAMDPRSGPTRAASSPAPCRSSRSPPSGHRSTSCWRPGSPRCRRGPPALGDAGRRPAGPRVPVAAPNGPVQRTPIVTFAPGEGSPMESVEAATAASPP